MPVCKKCNETFGYTEVVGGKKRSLTRRKFCLRCSPFKQHNTRDLTKPLPSQYIEGGTKKCSECEQLLSHDSYYRHKSGRRKGELKPHCIQCDYKRKVSTKERAVELLGGECLVCGYDRCAKAMDFHHKDPSKKVFKIAGRAAFTEELKSELRKCLLLCCRCHREYHSGFINLPNI